MKSASAHTIVPKHWYLIRHGETDYNARQIVQGSGVDSQLNAVGHGQAAAFHRSYGNLPFSAVFSSALQRTHQTLAPFVEAGLQHYIIPELNEISWGELEGQQSSPALRSIFHKTISHWANGELDFSVPGGESPLQVLARLQLGWQKVEQLADNRPILVCSHGRTLRILLAHLLGYDLKYMQHFEHHNTGLNVLAPAGHRRYALKINDIRHLKDS